MLPSSMRFMRFEIFFCKLRGSWSPKVNISCGIKIRKYIQNSFVKNKHLFINLSIYESSVPIKHINCLYNKISICILVVPKIISKLNFAKMILWWELGYKDGWSPDSVIKFGCEMDIRSIHEKEDSNICAGSLITWCKANCEEIFSIVLPSIAVMSFLYQLLYFALKPPRSTTKKGLF